MGQAGSFCAASVCLFVCQPHLPNFVCDAQFYDLILPEILVALHGVFQVALYFVYADGHELLKI
jgi:hypothetical protein